MLRSNPYSYCQDHIHDSWRPPWGMTSVDPCCGRFVFTLTHISFLLLMHIFFSKRRDFLGDLILSPKMNNHHGWPPFFFLVVLITGCAFISASTQRLLRSSLFPAA